ncbi:MAG: hypothetical protein F2839_04260 [Actinobacteria bacterium]|uniref:Unannotated protein n=1 Tax=freshwater metagenome TaxID=449393 RepID=A0A6J5ZC73_9ZZZZ|nr:hypothetical protein [Actinomycetota bacterium]
MDITGKFVVAVIMRDETRIWTTDAARGEEPTTIHPALDQHKHVREAQHHGGHDSSKSEKPYYEAISAALSPAAEILLIGHGTGKGNSMLTFVQHLERHHQDVAKKIVGAVDENIVAMTEPELLAAARSWIKAHRTFI